MAYKFKTTESRSKLMRRIKSSGTKPEIIFKKRLWGKGFRFSRKASKLPGRPDIVLTKYKTIIFVDGELWHGYNWGAKKKKIKANRSYWIPKIEKNILRDKKNNRLLKRAGWRVFRFWQHEIEKDFLKCFTKIQKAIKK